MLIVELFITANDGNNLNVHKSMNKEIMVYLYHEIVFSHEKEMK